MKFKSNSTWPAASAPPANVTDFKFALLLGLKMDEFQRKTEYRRQIPTEGLVACDCDNYIY